MWTLIKNNDIGKYLKEYPQFSEYMSELSLYDNQGYIVLPRLFYINYPSKYLIKYNGKNERKFQSINYDFKFELRKLQKEASIIVQDIYEKYGKVNGILKLPPGAGKTYLGIYLASKLKLKTCIIVNKDLLIGQWTKAILNSSNLTVDDIGLVQRNVFNMNKPITICMAQTLLSKIKHTSENIFSKILNEGVGLVIYDEVHSTSASENFSKISMLFNTENVLGLSATPFANDAHAYLMNNTIGNIIYESKEYEMIPEYNFVFYSSGLKNKKYITKKNKEMTIAQRILIYNDFIQRKSLYNKYIVESEEYVDLVCKSTQALLKNGHKIIIICFTHEQIKRISKKLEECKINHRCRYGKDQTYKTSDDVLVATYSTSGEAFDFPELSALIYATPLSGRKAVIQSAGRILRSSNGKISPVIVDLMDLDLPILFNRDLSSKLKIIESEWPSTKVTKIDLTNTVKQNTI